MKTPSIKPISTVFASHSEIEVFNICDVLTSLYPGYWEMDWEDRPAYPVWRAAVDSWAAEHGAHVYSEDRERYSAVSAAFEAEELGLSRVVVEDLSLAVQPFSQ